MPSAPKTFRSSERKKEREQFRGSKQSRGYGGEWERISRMKRQQTPVCEVCNDAPADDVDHIAPFNGVDDPKRTEWQNLQSICRACHNGKTHRRNGKMG
jgi:5-methylcytosine-specific restriction endonuclease McrA